MLELGVYIHYPWCRKRCPYCDFPIAIEPEAAIPHQRYLDAVLGELHERAADFAGRDLVSIYFGGGTPSLWPAEHLARAAAAVVARFPPAGRLEVTLEANPTDCTPARLAGWREAGVSRVSIGVQSFDPGELVALGRDHRFGDGAAGLAAALAAGLDSVSADLILGTPGAGDGGLASVGRLAAPGGPPHLSVYELTIEERTPFGEAVRAGRLAPRGEDELAAAYEEAHRRLTAAGYEHYEISSYARPGHRAVHNSLYWRGGEFLGLGAGAASFGRRGGGGVRQSNHRSVARYLAGARVAERHELDAAALAADRVWLGLRTSDGVPAELLADLPEVRAWLLGEGLADLAGGRVRPTLRGFLFADQVARRLVHFDRRPCRS